MTNVSFVWEEDHCFFFPEIDAWFTEDKYLLTSDLISAASYLVGDGTPTGLDLNTEYTRGMAELICDHVGLPQDCVGQVTACIKSYALERYKTKEQDNA